MFELVITALGTTVLVLYATVYNLKERVTALERKINDL